MKSKKMNSSVNRTYNIVIRLHIATSIVTVHVSYTECIKRSVFDEYDQSFRLPKTLIKNNDKRNNVSTSSANELNTKNLTIRSFYLIDLQFS